MRPRRNQGAGAPQGNRNAWKHGIYARWLTDEELADLLPYAEKRTAVDELALTRVGLARIARVVGRPDVEPQEVAAAMVHLVAAVRSVAYLLRTLHALEGGAGDGIAGAIAQALDEIGMELGIEL